MTKTLTQTMSMMTTTMAQSFSNPDQALIHSFLNASHTPMPVASNPMAIALGTSLVSVDAKAGIVELSFEPQPLFIQGLGILQGGAVSSMLDFAMAFAVLAHVPVGVNCTSVNLNTSFLRPAPAGVYLAVGEVERCGKTLAFANARLMHRDRGEVVATATSTLAVLPPR